MEDKGIELVRTEFSDDGSQEGFQRYEIDRDLLGSSGFVIPPSSRHVCLIRHGEKLSYLPKGMDKAARHKWFHLTSKQDGPLSTLGRHQAKETGKRLKGLLSSSHTSAHRSPVILSSPFLRTVMTAHEIAEAFESQVFCEYGLYEDMGSCKVKPQIQSVDALHKHFPTVDVSYASIVQDLDIRPGESEGDIQQRFAKVLNWWLQKTDRDLIFVSHCTPIMFMTKIICAQTTPTKHVIKPFFCALTDCRQIERESKTIDSSGSTIEESKEKPLDPSQSPSFPSSISISSFSVLEPIKLVACLVVELEASTSHISKNASYCSCCRGCLHQPRKICHLSCTLL